MARRSSRAELVNDPRSGARPLPGTPGPGEDEDEPATRELPAAPGAEDQADDDDEGQADDDEGQADDDEGQAPSGGGGGGSLTSRQKVGHSVAGVVVGLFLWGYIENWLRGGKDQANGWFKAKFFNEPWAGAGKGTGTSTPAPTAGSPAPSPTNIQKAIQKQKRAQSKSKAKAG